MTISMTRKWVVTAAAGAGALMGAAGLASAATNGTEPTTPAPQQQEAPDTETAPNYTSSITVPDTTESTDETAEAAALKAMVTLTPEQATASATAAVPGTADEVQLENDGGNVVYDVEIATANGHVDVKVDPGNGKILAQETEQNDGESADDKGGADKADQADKTDQTKDAADAPTNNGSVAKP
jgi:uncharacterized membrane protein YkoI